MSKLPAIPLIAVLRQYRDAHNLPFRLNRWEEIIRCYRHYTAHAPNLN